MFHSARRKLVGSLVAAVLGAAPLFTFLPAVTRSAAATAGAATVADGREVGFSMYGSFIGDSTSVIAANLDRAKAVGATWVRVPFNWSTLEMHGKNQYNWGPGDNVANAAAARGMSIDAVVSYTPSWARAAGTSALNPPTNLQDYADFMKAAAAHYAPLGIHTWEIWNEPNINAMWLPKPDPAKYTAMLKIAYAAVKSVDSSATIVTGGFSPAGDATDGSSMAPLTFLKAIYANGGKGSFDAVGHHPESFPYSVNYMVPWNAFQQAKDLYNYMVSQGDSAKKVWGTEFGFPTGTSSKAVSEATQGDRIAEGLESWRNFSFHGPIFIYSLQDEMNMPSSSFETMGLLHYDGTPKPSYQRVMQALRAPQHVAATTANGSVNVTWDAPGYDYGSSITSYNVTASPGGATVTVAATARSANVPVPDGSTYTLTVQPMQNGVPGVTSLPSNSVMPSVPTITPTSGSAVEGNSGTRILNIPVYLNKPSTLTVTAHYQTMSVAPSFVAAVPQDYYAASGTVTFAPGVTKANIPVTIVGDTVREPNGDKFLVALSNASNGVIGGFGGLGTGTIVDDD